jgi:hypothetical protein
VGAQRGSAIGHHGGAPFIVVEPFMPPIYPQKYVPVARARFGSITMNPAISRAPPTIVRLIVFLERKKNFIS